MKACIHASHAIRPDYVAAQAGCQRKLQEAFAGTSNYGRGPTLAVLVKPETPEAKDAWEIRQPGPMEHTVAPANIEYHRYVHGGPMLAAVYYFEWAGE